MTIDPVRLGQRDDRRLRERFELEPPWPAHQLAKHEAELLGAVELVIPIARQHESGRRIDPRREHDEHVERGLVRPMQILKDQHRWPATA